MASSALPPVPAVFFSALHLKKSMEKALASGNTVLSVKSSNDEFTNGQRPPNALGAAAFVLNGGGGRADICMEAHHSKKNVNIYVKVAEKLRETARPGLQEAHYSKKHVGQVECWEHSIANANVPCLESGERSHRFGLQCASWALLQHGVRRMPRRADGDQPGQEEDDDTNPGRKAMGAPFAAAAIE